MKKREKIKEISPRGQVMPLQDLSSEIFKVSGIGLQWYDTGVVEKTNTWYTSGGGCKSDVRTRFKGEDVDVEYGNTPVNCPY